MARTVLRFASIVVLICAPLAAQADSSQFVSTRCSEREIALDSQNSVAVLEGCGDEYDEDLLWHLDRIDQVAADLDGTFDRRNSGAGAVVYVMDTGIRADHSEFAGPSGSRVIGGMDSSGAVAIGRSTCRSSNRALAPCYAGYDELAASSHGTGVASVIAGRTVGVAPEASIVSVRVMNERGLATTRTYLEALDMMIHHAWSPSTPEFHTAVVNISGWVLERISGTSSIDGYPTVTYAAVEEKIRTMIEGVDADGNLDPNGKRFLFVVAANNRDGGCGSSGIVDRFPAILGKKLDGVITVGGMTADNSWWNGGCRGGIEVLAPAQQIFSATITGKNHYRGRKPNLRSGTSFAAPVISGIATRMLAERPDLTPQELEALITNTPSRIDNPSAAFADGKVAYVRSVGMMVTSNNLGDE